MSGDDGLKARHHKKQRMVRKYKNALLIKKIQREGQVMATALSRQKTKEIIEEIVIPGSPQTSAPKALLTQTETALDALIENQLKQNQTLTLTPGQTADNTNAHTSPRPGGN